MKRCPRCGATYGEDLERCPRDGDMLEQHSDPVEGAARGDRTEPAPFAGEGTQELEGAPGEVFLEATISIDDEAEGVRENTAQIAGEIEDLIFRVCTQCHSCYGGDIDVCPQDGVRLTEKSMLARETLFFGTEGLTDAALQLKKYCPKCKNHFPLHLRVCDDCACSLVIPTLGGGDVQPTSTAQAGQLIADKYRVIKDIGAGGFGSVYLAKHESLGKRYAIKVLRGKFSDITNFRNRFHEEALKLSRLEDESIVKVIDFGESEDFQYMVMEYVDAKDLSSLIYGQKVTPLRASRIMRQVAGALAEAHSNKIVHLDLKPANVLVSQKRGRDLVKVIDFGIAEIYSETKARRQENVAGTCTYMAPEQWRRQPLDPRADIYSFGVIFYEFLAGQPPFRHHKVSDLEKAHCQMPPPPLKKLRPDLPAELERLVHRCLEKDPTKRVQSAEKLEATLEGYVRRTENVLARWLRRIAVAAAALALVVVAAWQVMQLFIDKEPPNWVDFGAEGEDVEEVNRSKDSKSYRTRKDKVPVVIVAKDNRKVDHILVAWDTREGKKEEHHEGPRADVSLDLGVGTTHLTAQAFDTSQNPSKTTIHMTFERLPSLSGWVQVRAIPEYARERKLPLGMDVPDLEAATVKVTCENDGKPLYAARIEKGGKGLLHLVESDGEPPIELSLEETVKLEIPLEPGDNRIRVWTEDLFPGTRPPEVPDYLADQIVKMRDDPLKMTAKVAAGKDGKLLKLKGENEWLSGSEEIQIEIEVPGAKGRLGKACVVSYNSNDGTPQNPTWTEAEISVGKKRIPVRLDQERLNEITISPMEDLYRIRSDEVKLVVYRDTELPHVEVLDERVEYYEDELPSVRFRATDENLVEEGFKLLDASGQEVKQGHEFRRSGTDRELRFRDSSLFPDDGRYTLRIAATDRVDRMGEAEFVVLVDRNPPKIEIMGPEQGTFFKVDDTFLIQVGIQDAFRDGVVVTATVSGDALDSTYKKRSYKYDFTLDRVGEIWQKQIKIVRDTASAGADTLEKPRIFDTRTPGFKVVISARDQAGHPASLERSFRFGWENGERLLWEKDGSILVYHDEFRRERVGPFWIQSMEVSNRQYQKFLEAQGGRYDLRDERYWDKEAASDLGDIPCPRSSDWVNGRCIEERLDYPVRGISWYEARAYARWASLALPSRAQWLIAALGDYDRWKYRTYPWGDDWPEKGCPVRAAAKSPVRVDDTSGELSQGKTAAPFEFLHMFGNVRELVWCEKAGGPVPVGGGFREPVEVFRLEQHRSDHENYLRGEAPQARSLPLYEHDSDLGFRCVLLLEEENP